MDNPGTQEAPTDEQVKIQELEAEVAKLRDKEMNFEKLRTKAEETEKEKLANDSELERIKREQDERLKEIENQNQKWREDQYAQQKEDYLKEVCGEDQEFRDKLVYEMGQWKGEANTFPQWRELADKAHLVLNGTRPKPSAISKVMGSSSAPYKEEKKSFSASEEGKNVLNKITKGQVDWDKVPQRGPGTYFDNII